MSPESHFKNDLGLDSLDTVEVRPHGDLKLDQYRSSDVDARFRKQLWGHRGLMNTPLGCSHLHATAASVCPQHYASWSGHMLSCVGERMSSVTFSSGTLQIGLLFNPDVSFRTDCGLLMMSSLVWAAGGDGFRRGVCN